jgi:hypothetical protein
MVVLYPAADAGTSASMSALRLFMATLDCVCITWSGAAA